MVDIKDVVRPHLAEFKAFEPADPLEVMAARAGIPADRVIRLNCSIASLRNNTRTTSALALTARPLS